MRRGAGSRPLLLFGVIATVLRRRDETPAPDEVQVSADAQSELAPLLHPWKGSGDALAAVSMSRT